MSWGLVASVHAQSPDGNGITTGNINTLGADFIAIYINDANFFQTPADSEGNTWDGSAFGLSQGPMGAKIWFCLNPLTSANHNFTAGAASSFPTIQVMAWSGAISASVLDDFDSNGAASVSSLATNAVAPTVTGDLVITGVGTTSNGSGPLSIDNGFTIQLETSLPNPGAQYCGMAYKVLPDAASINPTWTFADTPGNAVAVIAAFKVEPEGVVGIPFFTQVGAKRI